MKMNFLFPTPVSMFNYNITDKEKKVIYKLKTIQNTGNKVSVNRKVLDSVDLKKLKIFILKNVNANKDSDKIYFHKEEKDKLKVLTENYNICNSSSWWLPVETGVLFLFPSYLMHSVDTVKNNDTRISLSFNTFLKGDIGSDSELTGLIL